jgi:hypothetical protein
MDSPDGRKDHMMLRLLTLLLFSTGALAQSCPAYKTSGPVTVTRNNQVVSNLIITALTVRNVRLTRGSLAST